MSGTLIRPMRGRDAGEAHRTSTPLELFFDLCFVAAVSYAAVNLRTALLDDTVAHALGGYITVFFAIWWAWMNFTWFASAYDTDDVIYRLTTFVQIGGALVLAAGITRGFEHGDFAVMTVGYLIMRLAMVSQWLRAARSDPSHRTTALRYAALITAVQVGWILRLWLPHNTGYWSFAVLAICEMAVPWVAERSNSTSWHPQHIKERYGLFTLIVLGEAVVSVTATVQSAVEASNHEIADLAPHAIAGLLIAFSLWWIYFDRAEAKVLDGNHNPFVWSYVHYFVFASVAAIGTSIEVVVELAEAHHEHFSLRPGLALGVATAVFLISVWLLHLSTIKGWVVAVKPIAAALVLAAGFTTIPVELVAAVLLALIAVTQLVPPSVTPTVTPAKAGAQL